MRKILLCCSAIMILLGASVGQAASVSDPTMYAQQKLRGMALSDESISRNASALLNGDINTLLGEGGTRGNSLSDLNQLFTTPLQGGNGKILHREDYLKAGAEFLGVDTSGINTSYLKQLKSKKLKSLSMSDLMALFGADLFSSFSQDTLDKMSKDPEGTLALLTGLGESSGQKVGGGSSGAKLNGIGLSSRPTKGGSKVTTPNSLENRSTGGSMPANGGIGVDSNRSGVFGGTGNGSIAQAEKAINEFQAQRKIIQDNIAGPADAKDQEKMDVGEIERRQTLLEESTKDMGVAGLTRPWINQAIVKQKGPKTEEALTKAIEESFGGDERAVIQMASKTTLMTAEIQNNTMAMAGTELELSGMQANRMNGISFPGMGGETTYPSGQ